MTCLPPHEGTTSISLDASKHECDNSYSGANARIPWRATSQPIETLAGSNPIGDRWNGHSPLARHP